MSVRRSLTLESDGRHLLTDVWTSVGVIAGVGAVALTGWERLDPIIALAVAINIVFTGVGLVRRFTGGLLDRALADDDRAAIRRVLDDFDGTVRFHALRTREAGRRSFASVHVLVPGDWSVQRGHDLLERVEASLRDAVPGLVVFTTSNHSKTRRRTPMPSSSASLTPRTPPSRVSTGLGGSRDSATRGRAAAYSPRSIVSRNAVGDRTLPWGGES